MVLSPRRSLAALTNVVGSTTVSADSELHLANGEFQLARRHPLLLGVMRMAAQSYR